MKKILIIILSFILFSCEDLLLEKPKSIAVEVFYNTSEEMEAAIAAIYGSLKGGNCMGGRYPAQINACADYVESRGSQFAVSQFQGLDATNITRVNGIWIDFYRSIRNANLVILNAPNGKELNEDEIVRYVGEAKFMRSLIYFIMVRNWGRIPLRTEENMTELDVPRSSVDEVYQLIIQDLLFAEENLPDNPPVPGRASKWAAKTVLADVYFYLARYPEARDKALEIINSNRFELVEISESEDFNKIFGPEVITSTEEIFYLKYIRQSDFGWGYPLFTSHPSTGFHPNGGYHLTYTDKEFFPLIKNWDKNDLRYEFNWHELDFGVGANTMLNKKFVDRQSIGTFGSGNDFPLYRYADLLLLYAEAACHAANQPTADALEKLNMVHRRAYGKNSLTPSEIDFKLEDYGKESFIDLVIKERGYETIFEAKRWLDLIRTGKVKEIIKEGTGKDVADVHLLLPIPVSEMEYNNAIAPEDQNPGY